MPGTWLYFSLTAVLIMFFTYFYTSIIFNPVDLAENLKKQGGFIPGIKPGAKTADYIDDVVLRITLPGAIFLTLIALLPIWIGELINVHFRFGGTSLLIVVGVALDTLAQMQQHLLLRKYDGFMKKGRVRFRGRQGAPAAASSRRRDCGRAFRAPAISSHRSTRCPYLSRCTPRQLNDHRAPRKTGRRQGHAGAAARRGARRPEDRDRRRPSRGACERARRSGSRPRRSWTAASSSPTT